jgi:putative alpha-1,2-mannosidase
VSIDLPNGKNFTILAKNVSPINKYIQSATLNGKELKSLSFSHEDLVRGGVLSLQMGKSTNKNWEIKY